MERVWATNSPPWENDFLEDSAPFPRSNAQLGLRRPRYKSAWVTDHCVTLESLAISQSLSFLICTRGRGDKAASRSHKVVVGNNGKMYVKELDAKSH